MTAPRTFRYRDPAGQTQVFSGNELSHAVETGAVPADARVAVDGMEGWIAVHEALALVGGPPSSMVNTPRGPAPPTPRMGGGTTAKVVKPTATANITPPTVPPPRSHKPTTLGLSDDVVIPKAPKPFQVPLPPGASPAPPPVVARKGQTVVMEPIAPPVPAPAPAPQVAGPHGTRGMQPYSAPGPKPPPRIPTPRATALMPLGLDAPPPQGAPAPPAPPPTIPTEPPPMDVELLAPPSVPQPSVRPPPPSVRPPPPSFQPPIPTHQGSTPPPPPSGLPAPMPPPQRPLALPSSKPTMPMQAFVPPPPSPVAQTDAAPSVPPPADEAPRPSLPSPEVEEAARRRKSFLPIVGAALGAAVLLVIVGVVVSALRKPSEPPPPPVSSAPPPATSSAPAPAVAASSAPVAATPPPTKPVEGGLGACSIAKAAVKLAPRASKDIPLEMTGIPATSRIALGYSVDGKSPYGVEIDPATLGVKKGVVPRANGTLRRVLAMPVANGAKWIVDADPKKASLRLAQTVAVEPTFVVGVAGDAIATADKVTDAWAPGPRIKGNPDLLRALVVPGAGSMVAVRAGDILSAVRLGADKAAKGDFVALADAGQAGTPSLGTNGVEIAVAFAHRDAATAPWGIKISRFLKDDAPAKAVPFAVPAGGPGGDAFAPAIAGLADGRWLLSWTEGATGSRVVRIATLNASGEALGEPLSLSVAKSNAGQPSLAVVGADALAVYLTSPKKGVYEIWGATLSCR